MIEKTDPRIQEAALVTRIVRPRLADLTPEAARAILALDLDERDRVRARDLSAKSQEAGLSREEEDELQLYRVVGHVIEMMRSRARISLKKAGSEVAVAGE